MKSASHGQHRLRPGTYDMLHRAQVEWPCLSVDVIRDDLGAQRALVPAMACHGLPFRGIGAEDSPSASRYFKITLW